MAADRCKGTADSSEGSQQPGEMEDAESQEVEVEGREESSRAVGRAARLKTTERWLLEVGSAGTGERRRET